MWIFGIGIWLWDFLWETFNDGKTPGKMIMKIRVVNKDGSRPNLGSFFMRWLFGNIDIGCSCVGILFILLTKDSQRLGDLAAGTIVIKEVNIEDIHVSLDEFYYAKKDYHPTYEEAKNLSQAQVEVIEKTVYSGNDKHEEQVDALARKVAKFLGIEERLKASLQKGNSKEKFLATILHDYNYYLMDLISHPFEGANTTPLPPASYHPSKSSADARSEHGEHISSPRQQASHPTSPY